MLSFMVLLVLILILAQIKYSTDTTSRVARNEETLVAMDSAIESALLQVFEDLKTDAESDGAGGMGGAGAEDLGGLGEGSGAGGDAAADADQGGGGPTDSKEDEWSRPQRTELNEIQLRILVQDEDSKFNLLSVLTPDEDEAEKALDRLARVIEWSRKGTQAEIDGSTARRMADAMANHMRRRRDQVLPKPELLSDTEDEDDVGMPLSLREFVALDPELFTPDLFRDYVDENGDVVHSLGSFLTVWSSIGTIDEANAAAQEAAGAPDEPGEDDAEQQDETQQGGERDPTDPTDPTDPEEAGEAGAGDEGAGGAEGEAPPGWAINVNTAPGAVLHALLDSRDLPYRFWDEVVLYRNEKDETVEENEDPPLDEYGREIIVKQFFTSVDDLTEIDGWENLEPIVQGELRNLLKVQSSVFSITVTARKPTGDEQIDPFARREDIEREEANWQGLVRTVRVVVWRRALGEGEVEILPIVRWEVIDYVPFEVLDFPESRDFR
jgi:hypothetical protein